MTLAQPYIYADCRLWTAAPHVTDETEIVASEKHGLHSHFFYLTSVLAQPISQVRLMRQSDQAQHSVTAVYLGDVPGRDDRNWPRRSTGLEADLEALSNQVLKTKEDVEIKEQSLWLSTSGARTHTHFDSDHNMFVQLLGEKKWTLFPPSAGRSMCPYPRLHQMWHKARPDFIRPDLQTCPGYAELEGGLEIVLRPGDVLYVPPFWWHHVESLTASASLTSYSRAYGINDHLHAVYGHDHNFDRVYTENEQNEQSFPGAKQPQGFILRLYLELLVRDLYIQPGRSFFGQEVQDTGDFFRVAAETRSLLLLYIDACTTAITHFMSN